MPENARFPAFTERLTHGKKPVFRHSQTFSLCFLEFSEMVNSRKGMFSNGKHSVNSRKIARISMLTDRSTEWKWLVFQCSPISYRTKNSSYSAYLQAFFSCFLAFYGKVNLGKRMFSEFSSHILDWQFRVNSRKPVLSTGVRGVSLAFAFSVGVEY